MIGLVLLALAFTISDSRSQPYFFIPGGPFIVLGLYVALGLPLSRTSFQAASTQHRASVAITGAIVAAVVVVGLVPGVLPLGPCTPPGIPSSGGRVCPIQVPPPTTIIGAGVTFAVGPAAYDFICFHPSHATEAVLNGSLTSTEGVVVSLVISIDFYGSTRCSYSLGQFPCSGLSNSCSWNVSVAAGSTYWWPSLPMPIVVNHSGEIEAWYLVMQNPNSSAATEITWVIGLVATYVDIYS